MKATTLYRIASVLLIVAAIGNSLSTMRFWHVAQALPPVHFPVGHAALSYAQVVLIFEVFSSLCVLFGAYLAWHLGSLARSTPQAIGALGWLLFSYQLVGICVSWIALSGLVRLLTVILAICVGRAAWLSSGVHEKSAATD